MCTAAVHWRLACHVRCVLYSTAAARPPPRSTIARLRLTSMLRLPSDGVCHEYKCTSTWHHACWTARFQLSRRQTLPCVVAARRNSLAPPREQKGPGVPSFHRPIVLSFCAGVERRGDISDRRVRTPYGSAPRWETVPVQSLSSCWLSRSVMLGAE